jgi:hypothetical protein
MDKRKPKGLIMKINFEELKKLGFEKDITSDSVVYRETGQYPIVVYKELFQGINKSLNKVKVSAEWYQEDGIVKLYTTNAEGYIISKLNIYSLKGLKQAVEFFESMNEL